MNPELARKDPDHPELKDAQLLFSVSLKKSWAKTPSYWIEIYGKYGPNRRFVRFYVYRQWAFLKGSIFDGKRELVAGGHLHPGLFTTPDSAIEKLVETAIVMADSKGYAVFSQVISPAGLALGTQLLERTRVALDGIRPSENVEKNDQLPIQFPRRKKEDFWETARQREKKAKW